MNETYELNNDNFKGYEIILHENNFALENGFGLYFIKLIIFFNNGNKLKIDYQDSFIQIKDSDGKSYKHEAIYLID